MNVEPRGISLRYAQSSTLEPDGYDGQNTPPEYIVVGWLFGRGKDDLRNSSELV